MPDEFDHNGFHCTRWWGEDPNSGTLFARVHAVKNLGDNNRVIFDTEARFGEGYIEFKLKEENPLEYIKTLVTEEAIRKIDSNEHKSSIDERMLPNG